MIPDSERIASDPFPTLRLTTMKTIHIHYFAILREERGCNQDTIDSAAGSLSELYSDLQSRFNLSMPQSRMRVALNSEFVDWDSPVASGDEVAFIPPVAGG